MCCPPPDPLRREPVESRPLEREPIGDLDGINSASRSEHNLSNYWTAVIWLLIEWSTTATSKTYQQKSDSQGPVYAICMHIDFKVHYEAATITISQHIFYNLHTERPILSNLFNGRAIGRGDQYKWWRLKRWSRPSPLHMSMTSAGYNKDQRQEKQTISLHPLPSVSLNLDWSENTTDRE